MLVKDTLFAAFRIPTERSEGALSASISASPSDGLIYKNRSLRLARSGFSIHMREACT